MIRSMFTEETIVDPINRIVPCLLCESMFESESSPLDPKQPLHKLCPTCSEEAEHVVVEWKKKTEC